MARYLTDRNVPPPALSAGQLTAASGLPALAPPFGGTLAGAWRPDAIAALLVFGILGTGLAYVLAYRIIADDGPLFASTVPYMLPVVAVIAGALPLDEQITCWLVTKVVVVLLGVSLTRRPHLDGRLQ